MRAVRSQDTAPEMAVRRFLHAQGLRYRLHGRQLPGSPDLVFAKKRAVVFVHGCFWHQHAGCEAAKRPKTSVPYWTRKLDTNVARDLRQRDALEAQGWEVFVVWECQVGEADTLASLASRLRDLTTSN